MFKNLTLRAVLTVGIGLIVSGSVGARSLPVDENGPKGPISGATASPAYCVAMHNVGKLALSVTNYGTFGTGAGGFIQGSASDCFTNEAIQPCEYPKGSNTQYCFAGAFWIGAVRGEDTLVSVGADGWLQQREMQPYDINTQPQDVMKTRSIIDPGAEGYELAVSEQDLIAIYTDTFTTGVVGPGQDAIDGRPHRPLGIEISQRSYAWSYSYAEDFVLFDYTIRNNSNERLDNVYMGLYVDADVGEPGDANNSTDDVCGFLNDIPSPPNYSGSCTYFRDTVYIAWIADNDGNLNAQTTVPHVTGSRIIRTPAESLNVSFNWWVSNGSAPLDFGPRERDKARDLGTGGKGTPEGDRNKYFFLRNAEHDYDQVYTASITISDTMWEYPNQALAGNVADGFDTRYLLSFGPFTLEPGDDGPLSFAYVAGENFHTVSNNAAVNLPDHPDTWISNVSFEDIGLNSMWASWVYDNPGVDTDNNGSKGSFRVCNDSCTYDTITVDPLVVDTNCFNPDTLYYTGDGAPDFRGASPPPAPIKWVYPSQGKLRVRWNGLNSETAKDVFSRVADFEGYRVYVSRDDRAASFSPYASYDVEDYNKYQFTTAMPGGGSGFVLKDLPFTREQLINLYGGGNPNWDPESFTINNQYRLPGFLTDSIFYFAPQDFNQSELGVTTPIHKIYPDAPKPTILDADSIPANARDSFLTEDGYFKYWEYEYVIEPLLPTVPWFVNVTAFDFGSPQSGLGSLETSVTVNYEIAYPQPNAAVAEAEDLPVYIYPNPYRFDGQYRADGFEGRDKETRGKAPDRQRTINFANLPSKCTIRIFTLDGDLVREFSHDVDPTDPTSSHDSWDLITRNTQLVVSGIYYWTVEEPDGKIQMGKLVVIM
jgi:hypothetical protein